MSAFLYWVPGESTGGPKMVEAAGLSHVFDRSAGVAVCSKGPDGVGGAILARGNLGGKHGYYPDVQEWQKVAGQWLGWPKDNPPGPDDLVRDTLVDGWDTELADGNAWVVPVVRVFPKGTRLPQTMVLGPAGQWVGQVREEFVDLCQAVGVAWDFFFAAPHVADPAAGFEGRVITLPDAADLAVRGLTLNYRVGRREVSALRLLDDKMVGRVIGAMFDLPAVIRAAEAVAAAQADGKKGGAPTTA